MTAVIIAIVVVVVVAIVILVALPRIRANARERELNRRRGEAADEHRDHATQRLARAEEAEHVAAKERAEAELHEARARLHEHGLADDELDGDARPVDDTERFERDERIEPDATIPPEERPARR